MLESFKEVLIFVAGFTPQVITETIFALSQQSPGIYPDEIFILTTSLGKQRVMDSLVTKGILEQMCTEYDLPAISLTEESFIVIRDDSGHELNDIRNVVENDAAGDLISQFLQYKSAEPNSRLHCSLTGGNESLSYYMGTAFQFYARQWDKLYHVLVSPEFEGNEHFFYKPKVNRKIKAFSHAGTDKYLNTDDAEISLIELPRIFLRDKFPINNSINVRDLIAKGQKRLDTAAVQQSLRVSFAESSLFIGNKRVKLQPMQLMLYTALLREKQAQTCEPLQTSCYNCHGCFVPIADLADRKTLEKMALDYQRMYRGNTFRSDEMLRKWPYGIDAEALRQKFCKINTVIEGQLNNPTLFPFYEVVSDRKYAGSSYGVRLEKEDITIE